MKTNTILLTVTLVVALFSSAAVIAKEVPTMPQEPVSTTQPKQQPPIKMLAPGIFEIGGCTIDKEHGRVEFPASVNMKEGLIEYLVVGSAGKLHESLLQTRIEPYALHIALLLAGMEGSTTSLEAQGQDVMPQGDLVEIYVTWPENGKEKKVAIQQFMLADGKSVPDLPWVFTGSKVIDGVFMAQIEKSIVAVYHDPTALIDHQLTSGANDEIWTINTSMVPEVGTNVKVIIVKK